MHKKEHTEINESTIVEINRIIKSSDDAGRRSRSTIVEINKDY